jgi:ABC-type amino acid transport system permease subunit
MSSYDEQGEADHLREEEDPDPSDTDDEREEEASDWSEEPVRRRWVWTIIAILVVVCMLAWIFRGGL